MDNQHRLKFLAQLIHVHVRVQNFALLHSTNIFDQGPIGNVLDFWKIGLSDLILSLICIVMATVLAKLKCIILLLTDFLNFNECKHPGTWLFLKTDIAI